MNGIELNIDFLLLILLVISGPLHFALECWDDSIHWRETLVFKEHVVHSLLAMLALLIAMSANRLLFAPSWIPLFLVLIVITVVCEEVFGIHDRCAMLRERVLHSVIFLNGTFLAMALFHIATKSELAQGQLFTWICRLLFVGATLRLIGVAACFRYQCILKRSASSPA
jgi:hypothetical protein